MLTEVLIVGGFVGVLMGVVEVSTWLDGQTRPLTAESAVRAAMRGPEGDAVRAEFRKSGIEAPGPDVRLRLW